MNDTEITFKPRPRSFASRVFAATEETTAVAVAPFGINAPFDPTTSFTRCVSNRSPTIALFVQTFGDDASVSSDPELMNACALRVVELVRDSVPTD